MFELSKTVFRTLATRKNFKGKNNVFMGNKTYKIRFKKKWVFIYRKLLLKICWQHIFNNYNNKHILEFATGKYSVLDH